MAMYKLCKHCGGTVPYKGPNVCTTCRPQQEAVHAENNRQYNRNRDKKYTRFYQSKTWKMIAQKKLADAQYLCETCKKEGKTQPNGSPVMAQEIHHTIPIQTPQGWALRFDVGLLKALCIHCHNREHKRF